LFIHGFNVSFLSSVYKCAQIKCDFKLKDPIVLFSWPSQGSVLDYSYDKESADYSRDAVFSLLEDLTREGIEEICVIAHSMGNLCLAQGLNRASTPPRKLTRLVMAAADIALDSFSDFHLKDIRRFFDKVALYVSNSDRALRLSKKFNSQARVGDSSTNVAVYPDVDTVDMSGCDGGVFSLRHSYFSDSNRVMDDIHRYLIDGTPADCRRLDAVNWANGLKYYKIKV